MQIGPTVPSNLSWANDAPAVYNFPLSPAFKASPRQSYLRRFVSSAFNRVHSPSLEAEHSDHNYHRPSFHSTLSIPQEISERSAEPTRPRLDPHLRLPNKIDHWLGLCISFSSSSYHLSLLSLPCCTLLEGENLTRSQNPDHLIWSEAKLFELSSPTWLQ